MIPRVKAILSALLLALAGAALPARGQPSAVPPAPVDRLLDDSRVLAREPARRQAIEEALAGLEGRHGFRMYFALFDSLIGSTPADRARELRAAWLGNQPGMVLVLETDSRAFRASIDGRGGAPGDAAALTAGDLAALAAGLEPRLAEARDGAAFAETLGVGMARALSAALDARAARPAGDGGARTVVLAIGLIAAVGLGALLVAAGLKRAEARSRERYVFPKVHVGTRLGAPYGGGKIRARSFGGKDRA